MFIPIVEEVSILIQNKGAILKYLCHAAYDCKVVILGSSKVDRVIAPRKVNDPKTSDGDFDTPVNHLRYLRPGINLILNEPGPVTDAARLKILAEAAHGSLHLLYKFPAFNGGYPYAHITLVDLCLTHENEDEVGIINVSHSGCTDFQRVYISYRELHDNITSRQKDPKSVKFTGVLNTSFFTLADILESEPKPEPESESESES